MIIVVQDTARFQVSVRDLLAITALAAILAAASRAPDDAIGGNGQALRFYSALLVIYVAKFGICRAEISRRMAAILFGLLLLLMLPYIYGCLSLFNEPFGLAPSKWIGDPVAVFLVPSASFFLLDLRKRPPSWRWYLSRSILELVIGVPLWLFVWAWAQLFLGWAWI